jgi:hypothetical protein
MIYLYPPAGETPRSRAKPNRRRKSRNAASGTNNNTPQRRKPPSLNNDDFNASVIANGSLPYPCDDLVSALQPEGGGAKLCYSVGNSPYRAYSTPPLHRRLAQQGEPPEPPLRGPSSYNGVRAGGSLHSFRENSGLSSIAHSYIFLKNSVIKDEVIIPRGPLVRTQSSVLGAGAHCNENRIHVFLF